MCHVAAATQSAQLRPLRRQTCPPTLLATTVFRTAQPTVNYGVQERQQVPNVFSAAPHTSYHRSSQLGLTGSPGSNPRRNLQLGGAGRLREHSLSIMVYDWDGKREICYQMYIKDKKALEEIMEYMKTAYQFAPR